MMFRLERQQWIPRPLPQVFAFFSNAFNLEAITPSWLHFRITEAPAEMRAGARIAYRLRVRGIPLHWLTEIEQWQAPVLLVDVQKKGPYKLWRHTHRFQEAEGGTRMFDVVEYALPLGPFGRLAHALQVRRDIERIFDYRAKKIAEVFGRS
jgi:hypothetical protein